MVPWLLAALEHADSSLEVAARLKAARLKAAAMQLLPPLLDGLHARMLNLLAREQCARVRRLLLEPFFDTLARPGTAPAGAGALVAACVCPAQM